MRIAFYFGYGTDNSESGADDHDNGQVGWAMPMGMLRRAMTCDGARRLLGVWLAFAAALVVADDARAQQFSTNATHAILMDYETGSILFQKNADELMPPASMSKLMTLAVLFEALKEGRIKLEDSFLVSVHAWRTGGGVSAGSSMLIPLNSRISIGELVQGIIVQSGNDASIVVAEGLGGSEPAFAQIMTQTARKIGLAKSTFGNATGLPNAQQLMTAYELAILARHLISQYPEYYAWFGQKEYKFLKHRFINRNPLLFMNIAVDGLKTGQTTESGFGIVASSVQDGRRLIAVLNGLPSKDERKNDAVRLLDWGNKNFTAVKLYDGDEIIGRARVWGGSSYFVELKGAGEVSVLLPKNTPKSKYTAEVVYKGPLKPPIKKGDAVAVLRVTTPGGSASEVPLVAAEDVARSNVLARGLDSLVHLAFRWVPL